MIYDPSVVEPGALLDDKYRVGRIIGRGGMGVVFEATNVALAMDVAIKVMRADFASKQAAVDRFLREAKMAAKLRGEHVCRIYDVGMLADGAPYIVMERLEGRDLSKLAGRSPLAADLVAPLIVQACAALGEAHAIGMIHRDIKPANLFVVRRPNGTACVKVLDFGIAKPAEVDLQLTDTHSQIGSPPYMSPEQLRSARSVTPKTDVWSLGIVMYELVTGKRPFTGETPFEVALAVANEPLPPLPPSVPAELAQIICRCLEKDPDKRFPDVAALAHALEPDVPTDAAASQILVMPTIERDSVATVDSRPTDPPTTLRGASAVVETVPPPRKRRKWIPISIGLVVIGGWAATIFYLRSDGAPAAAPVVAPATTPTIVAPPDAAAPAVADAAEPAVAESIDAAVEAEPDKTVEAEPVKPAKTAPAKVVKRAPVRKAPLRKKPPKPVQRKPVDLSKSRY